MEDLVAEDVELDVAIHRRMSGSPRRLSRAPTGMRRRSDSPNHDAQQHNGDAHPDSHIADTTAPAAVSKETNHAFSTWNSPFSEPPQQSIDGKGAATQESAATVEAGTTLEAAAPQEAGTIIEAAAPQEAAATQESAATLEAATTQEETEKVQMRWEPAPIDEEFSHLGFLSHCDDKAIVRRGRHYVPKLMWYISQYPTLLGAPVSFFRCFDGAGPDGSILVFQRVRQDSLLSLIPLLEPTSLRMRHSWNGAPHAQMTFFTESKGQFPSTVCSYSTQPKDGSNILRKDRLEWVKLVEQEASQSTNYAFMCWTNNKKNMQKLQNFPQCVPFTSITTYFFPGELGSTESGYVDFLFNGKGNVFQGPTASVFSSFVQNPAHRWFVGKEFGLNNFTSSVLRTQITIGYPVLSHGVRSLSISTTSTSTHLSRTFTQESLQFTTAKLKSRLVVIGCWKRLSTST